MKAKDADNTAKAVGRAFRLDEDRIEALADELVKEQACPACVARAVEHLVRDLPRLPQNPIPVVLQTIRSVFESDHASHVAHGIESDSMIAAAETWWRTTAVGVVLKHAAGDKTLAGFIAARMWQSQAVGMSVEQITEELHHSPHVWIRASQASLSVHGGDNPEHYVERAWAFAREVAKMPPQHWTDQRFKELAV